MADRFFIFNAAFNGDGTTNAEAASDGAAGAWNQQSILTGTAPAFGTLPAGADVYVRSKTGAGGDLDINVALGGSITLGSANGTLAAPITWILDNGVKWAGKNGTLTYQDGAATNYVVTLRDYNNFIALTKWNWIFKAVNAAANNSVFLTFGNGYTDGLFVDANISAAAGRIVASGGGVTKQSVNRNFKFSNSSRSFSGALQSNGVSVFENIEWEVTYGPASSNTKPLILLNGGSTGIKFIGGRVFGAGCVSGVPLLGQFSTSSTGHIAGIGFAFPVALMTIPLTYSYAIQSINVPLSFIGADDGLGAVLVDKWGQVDSRDDGNYPKLSAVLPNSTSTPWSWRLWPYLAAGALPVSFTVMNAVYSDTAASKKVTLDVLISNTITTCDKSNSWITVVYTDNATGLQVCESSLDFAAGALDAGSLSWNTTSWGFVACTAKQFNVTTAGSIKQNTQVIVTLHTTVPGTGTNDVWFVDAAATLGAP